MSQRPKHGRSALLFAALSALALVSVSCAPTNDRVTTRCPSEPDVLGRGGALSQVFEGMLVTGGRPGLPILDPALAADTASHEVVSLLYDGLVTLDAQQRVEPWGATRWDISSDGRTYTFHLLFGQSFADGAPVHASDYAFAINRALNPCLASPLASDLFALKDAATFTGQTCQRGAVTPAADQTGPLITTLLGDSILPDDTAGTLTLILAQPAGSFLSALTTPAASALEPSVVGNDIISERWTDTLSQSPTSQGPGQGTSGMYYLAGVDRPHSQVILKQNPHWWGRIECPGGPYLTEIVFTLFQDATTAYAAYRAGEFDVGYPPVSALAEASREPDYHTATTLRTIYLLLDWSTPPFDNRDARLAFCLAVNRDTLNQEVYGSALLPTWHLVPQGMPGYNPHLIGPDGITDSTRDATMGDAARAQAHWQAYLATLHGKAPPPVTLSYQSGSATQPGLARELQQQWRAVLNLNVSIAPAVVGPGVPLNAPPASFVQQAGIADWQDAYPDPQDVLSRLFLPESSSALDHTEDPQAISLLRQADVQAPSASRLALYQRAESLLLSQVAVCPLLQGAEHYQVRSYVHGLDLGYRWSLATTGFPADDTWRAAYLTAH